MNLSRPSVSVVIPAHDRPEYLVQALDSVMSQTHQPDEIIVVDDASSVDLMSVALSYPREIRFVRQQAKKGANAARNAGAALATSDLIAFLDDDDIWLAQKLE
ncbi:MAG: glycosyltransferase family 2 protein, partial [Hyphomonadaceae bacterium]